MPAHACCAQCLHQARHARPRSHTVHSQPSKPSPHPTSPSCARCLPSQRILAGDYSVPDGVEVSKGCRDLLDRMLEPDPGRRISVPGIQRHPWFRQDLPPELRRQLPVAARHSWLPWTRKKKVGGRCPCME